MENKNTPSFELKLDHQFKHEPEAKDFSIDVNAKIFRQGSDPFIDVSFSSTVDEFIWEDEDCPEKVQLYELFVDAGIIELEAQFLLNDIILYVCRKVQLLDDEFKGVFTLTIEVRLPPLEPVELNQAGTEQTQYSQEPIATTKTGEQHRRTLKPKQKIQKARYKIGADGVSLVKQAS